MELLWGEMKTFDKIFVGKLKKKKRRFNMGDTNVNGKTTNYFRKLCTGCETWSLSLREERRLRVFENKVLRRIFGPRSDEVTGGAEETA